MAKAPAPKITIHDSDPRPNVSENVMNFALKMMDFASKTMNFASKMMDFASKTMNFVF